MSVMYQVILDSSVPEGHPMSCFGWQVSQLRLAPGMLKINRGLHTGRLMIENVYVTLTSSYCNSRFLSRLFSPLTAIVSPPIRTESEHLIDSR